MEPVGDDQQDTDSNVRTGHIFRVLSVSICIVAVATKRGVAVNLMEGVQAMFSHCLHGCLHNTLIM